MAEIQFPVALLSRGGDTVFLHESFGWYSVSFGPNGGRVPLVGYKGLTTEEALHRYGYNCAAFEYQRDAYPLVIRGALHRKAERMEKET